MNEGRSLTPSAVCSQGERAVWRGEPCGMDTDGLNLPPFLQRYFNPLLSPAHTPPLLTSSFFFIPLPVCPWWCVGWREDEGRDGGCCNRELSSSLCRLVESQGDTMSGCADLCLFLLLLLSLRRGTLLHLPHPRGAAGSQAAVPREHPGIKGCSQG